MKLNDNRHKRELNNLSKMEYEGYGSDEDELKLDRRIFNSSQKMAFLRNFSKVN